MCLFLIVCVLVLVFPLVSVFRIQKAANALSDCISIYFTYLFSLINIKSIAKGIGSSAEKLLFHQKQLKNKNEKKETKIK